MTSTPSNKRIALGGLVALLTAAAYAGEGTLQRVRHGTAADPGLAHVHAVGLLTVGAAVCGALLAPALPGFIGSLDRKYTRPLAAAALAVVSLALALWIVHFGRLQFGAFDFNILVETGWRESLGQRPGVDFLTTAPPLFNLGIGAAYRLLGPSWDAGLYLAAAFAVATFLWLYALLRRLGASPAVALGASLLVQVVAMLPLSFWWYNNATLIAAAVWFAASLALLDRRPTRPIGTLPLSASYIAAAALVALSKPNIGGIALVCGVPLLLLASADRWRTLLLSCAGLLLAWLLLLAGQEPLRVLLASYSDASHERGGLHAFGLMAMGPADRWLTLLVWLPLVSLPLLRLVRPLQSAWHAKDVRRAATLLLYPVPLLIAVAGIAGNGELRDLEFAPLLVADLLLFFVPGAPGLHAGPEAGPEASIQSRPTALQLGASIPGPRALTLTVATLLAMIVPDLYIGAARLRVASIGPGKFYVGGQPLQRLSTGPLKGMRVSAVFVEVEREVAAAESASPGPYFYGPRVDFNYMALAQPSPPDFPAWWHPGTAFARSREPALLARWQRARFPTLVFLRGDTTYYPEPFLSAIRDSYTEDDSYPHLTVWHRKPAP